MKYNSLLTYSNCTALHCTARIMTHEKQLDFVPTRISTNTSTVDISINMQIPNWCAEGVQVTRLCAKVHKNVYSDSTGQNKAERVWNKYEYKLVNELKFVKSKTRSAYFIVWKYDVNSTVLVHDVPV